MQGRYSDQFDFDTHCIILIHYIAPSQFVYKEYQARGPIHVYVVHLRPDGTAVRSALDPFGTSIDICFVRNRIMHSQPHKVMTDLPEIQSRY